MDDHICFVCGCSGADMSFPGDKWMHEYWISCVNVLKTEIDQLHAALDEAIGRAPGDGEVAAGEAAQIVINVRRGPLGDRWISEEPWPSLIADERVAAVRPSWAGSQWEIEMHETGERSDG